LILEEGPSGTGKSFFIKESLKEENGVLYVDSREVILNSLTKSAGINLPTDVVLSLEQTLLIISESVLKYHSTTKNLAKIIIGDVNYLLDEDGKKFTKEGKMILMTFFQLFNNGATIVFFLSSKSFISTSFFDLSGFGGRLMIQTFPIVEPEEIIKGLKNIFSEEDSRSIVDLIGSQIHICMNSFCKKKVVNLFLKFQLK